MNPLKIMNTFNSAQRTGVTFDINFWFGLPSGRLSRLAKNLPQASWWEGEGIYLPWIKGSDPMVLRISGNVFKSLNLRELTDFGLDLVRDFLVESEKLDMFVNAAARFEQNKYLHRLMLVHESTRQLSESCVCFGEGNELLWDAYYQYWSEIPKEYFLRLFFDVLEEKGYIGIMSLTNYPKEVLSWLKSKLEFSQMCGAL
jgi:hypothetical protein